MLTDATCVRNARSYCLEAKWGVNVSVGSLIKPLTLFFFLFGRLAAIFNVDDSVVDLETLAALYENVSTKDPQN